MWHANSCDSTTPAEPFIVGLVQVGTPQHTYRTFYDFLMAITKYLGANHPLRSDPLQDLVQVAPHSSLCVALECQSQISQGLANSIAQLSALTIVVLQPLRSHTLQGLKAKHTHTHIRTLCDFIRTIPNKSEAAHTYCLIRHADHCSSTTPAESPPCKTIPCRHPLPNTEIYCDFLRPIKQSRCQHWLSTPPVDVQIV